MNIKKISVLLVVIFLTFSLAVVPSQITGTKQVSAKAVSLSNATLVIEEQSNFFTENKGQWNSQILFAGKTSFGAIAFAKDGIYYQQIQHKNAFSETASKLIKLAFVNPSNATIVGEQPLPHFNNYLIGSDASQWKTRCQNFKVVSYRNIWTGIDLNYFFTPQGIKYEFYVDPIASIQDIQIQVFGAGVAHNSSSLQYTTPLGVIEDSDLKTFDQSNQSILASHFSVENGIISFQGIPENREHTITIDPLIYSTYLGGAQNDEATSITVDSAGCAYIAGFTNSALADGFPVGQPIWFDTVYGGATDAFVTKLNPSGTAILYTTYLGGAQNDEATSITVDSTGCAYIAGFTNSALADGFPVGQPIWFDTVYGGQTDAFVSKLNTDGTGLLFSTYIGGSKHDQANAIAIDSIGNVYVAGKTFSALADGFPVGQPIWFDTVFSGATDAFVVKLNPTGTTQLFGTYIGGSQNDQATSLAVDNVGNVYVAGSTDSSLAQGFPVGQPIWFDTVYGGATDAFVVKLNPAGTSQLFGTYIGGSQYDQATSLVVDASGNVYVAGYTDSSLAQGFPVGQPIWFDTVYGGATDAFVVKLNTLGTSQIFGTYIGGSQDDRATSLAVDASGNVYVAGYTNSSLAQGFPVGQPIWFDTTFNGATDAFITKFDPTGVVQLYGTYLGGTGNDRATSMAVDSAGFAYITGYTDSTEAQGFPVGQPIWFDTTFNGGTDAFIAKLGFGVNIGPSSPSSPQGTRLGSDSVELTWQASNPGLFPVAKYMVYKSTNDQFDSAIQVAEITNLSSLDWIDYNANVKTTYYYWITAVDTSLPTPVESAPSLMVIMPKQVMELICNASSVVEISLINLSGQRTGYFQGSLFNEIPNAFLSPDTQSISVLSDSIDNFSGIKADVVGKQSGTYTFSMKIIDSSGTVPKIRNIYEANNQPVLLNQIDTYELDWSNFFANLPYTMNVRKDFNGDLIVDQAFSSPYTPESLLSQLDFDVIHLRWQVAANSTFPVNSYQIYRSLDNQIFTLLTETMSTSYTDNSCNPGHIYYYCVTAKDTLGNVSPFSLSAFAGPVTATPNPELNLSVELNKSQFSSGENLIYRVEISNVGFRESYETILALTLPNQIQYQNNDQFIGDVQPNGQVFFRIGTILRRSTISFQINAVIVSRVTQETGITSIFDLSATGIDTIRRLVGVLLVPTKSGSTEQKISVSLKNTHYDEETGSYYINSTDVLAMNVFVDGFTLPYSISINWGDGTIETFSKQSETSKIWNHQFVSKGMMTIKIYVLDSIGRTKEVSVRLQVR